MIRAGRWLIHRVGLTTLACLLLLLAALGSLAAGLADAVRGLDVGLLLPVAALAMVAGWGMARYPVPGWLAGLAAAGIGFEVVVLRVGRLTAPLLALLRRAIALVWGIWRWRVDGPPDTQPLVGALGELASRIAVLLGRLSQWVSALSSGQPAFDLVAVAIVWSLAVWAVGVWAGWYVRRHNRPLQGLLPAGALLATTLFYQWGSAAWLLPVLAAALLLSVLIGQSVRTRRWEMAGMDFPSEVGLEVVWSGAALSLVLVMLAMLTPSISVQQMIEWFERAARGRPGEARPGGGYGADTGGSVSGPEPVLTEDSVRAPGWPRRHLLGSGPELSEQVVMMIYPVQGDASGGAAMATPGGPRPQFYWRGLTYDQYTGLGWYASETETVEYGAGEAAVPAASVADLPEGRALRMVRHKVQVVEDLDGLLHAPGILVAADHDYSVAWRSRPGEGDRFAGDAFGAVIRGARYPAAYRVDSWVNLVGEAALRSAGAVYPEWVRNRYLAVPDRVPARVVALARDLTATEPTPYDRALAIETYLRTIPYSLDLPRLPRDRDVVDYFLFDLRQGYCDYYATAMVVLARAAGMPARLVVGYASGTYDEADNRYIVTEADAHSWVEIYFPGYGWVEFEPTSARPTFERSTGLPAATPPDFEPLVRPGIGLPGFWWVGFPGMALLVGVGLAAWSVIDGWRLRRLSLKMAAAELYGRLYRSGRRLSVPMRTGDTPYEFVASLAGWVTRRLEGTRWAAPLSPVTGEARWLVELYVRSCYARGAPDAADLKLAMQMWRRLQRRLWLVRIWGLVERFK